MPMDRIVKPVIAVAVPGALAWTKYRNYFETLAALGATPEAVGVDFDPMRCAGLLLPGGVDVNPKRYGQEDTACGAIDDALDELQFTTLAALIRAGKPVFGICRGLQVLNVHLGGTLIQHLPQSAVHAWDRERETDRAHASEAAKGCFLCDLYGERFRVNSAHHQAIDRPGEGLTILQHSPDGVIEAVAHEALPLWAVQWHPERMTLSRRRSDTVDGAKVLGWFIQKCIESGF